MWLIEDRGACKQNREFETLNWSEDFEFSLETLLQQIQQMNCSINKPTSYTDIEPLKSET